MTRIPIAIRPWLGMVVLGVLVPVLPALAQADAGKPALADHAAPAPAAPPPPTTGRIEAGVGAAHLNGADGDWRDVYVRGYVRPAPGTTINAELASQGHFNQRGTLGAISILQDLSADWFVMAGVSSGSAEFQYRLRGDVGIYRKWGATRQWVTGLTLMRGLGGDHVHRDTMPSLTVAYYSTDGWVAEGGAMFNRSQPGSVRAARAYGALTVGQQGHHLWMTRIDHGREAYLPAGATVGGAPSSVAFTSTEVGTVWRQWLRRDFGYTVGLQYYRNPYYKRAGVTVGVFFDF